MTAVNCLQSPTSSSTTSLSSPASAYSKVSASCLSSFCFKSNLVLDEVAVYKTLANSALNTSRTPCKTTSLSPSLPRRTTNLDAAAPLQERASMESYTTSCPLNVSLLTNIYRGCQDSSLALIEGQTADDLRANIERKEESMLEGIHKQQPNVARKCSTDDEARSLKLAVGLTMLNLNKAQQTVSTSPATATNKCQQQQLTNMQSPLGQAYSAINPYHMTTKVFLQTQSQTVISSPMSLSGTQMSSDIDIKAVSRTNSLTDLSQSLAASIISEERSKKSQNMTECVPVPSSEHVAEIVGRQGCKIKALRAKTNTYIKTPVRNEEPVFVVTGRKEDVSKAKHEILSAAEHFTVIRATRRLNDNVVCNSPLSGGKQHILGLYKNNTTPSAQSQGQVTIQVRVPYRLVGLVVGTKGNTIKHIQHETQTYIVTPSRDKEPIFEVTGLADNVELARRHIEIHIATRVGNSHNNSMATSVSSPSPSPCATVRQSTDADSAESSLQSLNALNQMLNDDLHSEILSSIYKNGICSTLDCRQVGGNIMNLDDKCNNLHSLNGFIGDINGTMLNVDGKEGHSSYSLNDQVNNQIKCADFINNLMDSNVTQFGIEQRARFT